MKTSFCCKSLQVEVLILSAIDGLSALILLGLVINTFYPELVGTSKLHYDFDFILTFALSVGALLIQLLLACVLFYGTKFDKQRPCFIWLGVSTLLLILKVIIVIVHLATGNHDIISYGLLVDSVYKLYEGLIVMSFIIGELNDDGGGSAILNKKRTIRRSIF